MHRSRQDVKKKKKKQKKKKGVRIRVSPDQSTWLGGDTRDSTTINVDDLTSSQLSTVIQQLSGTHSIPTSTNSLSDPQDVFWPLSGFFIWLGPWASRFCSPDFSNGTSPKNTSRIVHVDHQDATATISAIPSPFTLHAATSRTRFFTLVSTRTLQAASMRIVRPVNPVSHLLFKNYSELSAFIAKQRAYILSFDSRWGFSDTSSYGLRVHV